MCSWYRMKYSTNCTRVVKSPIMLFGMIRWTKLQSIFLRRPLGDGSRPCLVEFFQGPLFIKWFIVHVAMFFRVFLWCLCFRLWTCAFRRLCVFAVQQSTLSSARRCVCPCASVRVVDQMFFCTILFGWFDSLRCFFFRLFRCLGVVFSLVCVLRFNRGDMCARVQTQFLPFRQCFSHLLGC